MANQFFIEINRYTYLTSPSYEEAYERRKHKP